MFSGDNFEDSHCGISKQVQKRKKKVVWKDLYVKQMFLLKYQKLNIVLYLM